MQIVAQTSLPGRIDPTFEVELKSAPYYCTGGNLPSEHEVGACLVPPFVVVSSPTPLNRQRCPSHLPPESRALDRSNYANRRPVR